MPREPAHTYSQSYTGNKSYRKLKRVCETQDVRKGGNKFLEKQNKRTS